MTTPAPTGIAGATNTYTDTEGLDMETTVIAEYTIEDQRGLLPDLLRSMASNTNVTSKETGETLETETRLSRNTLLLAASEIEHLHKRNRLTPWKMIVCVTIFVLAAIGCGGVVGMLAAMVRMYL